MQAVQLNQFGGPEVLHLVDVPKPSIKDDELLIKVSAAGVNPLDGKIRDARSLLNVFESRLPISLGYDLCGSVEQCGSSVSGFKLGDSVFGMVGLFDRPGAYAEYYVAKPAELAKKPEKLDDIQAGALPIAGLTAWQAIHRHGKLQAGERVLIHAAAGGVGHLAVQIAKRLDAFVIATASAKHHEFLSELGVDQLIDYTRQPFEDVANDVDLVIDLVGGETGLRSLKVLKSEGRLVTVPTLTRDEILDKAKQLGLNASGMIAAMSAEDLQTLADLIVNQAIKLKIAHVFPLQNVVSAHQQLDSKSTQGKIVLTL